MSGTVWVNGPGYAAPAQRDAAAGVARRRLQAVPGRERKPHAWPAARASLLQPAGAGVRLSDGGHPDANGAERRTRSGRSRSARRSAIPAPTDDADVQLIASVTDVRNKTGLADYTGRAAGEAAAEDHRQAERPGRGRAGDREHDLQLHVPCTATGAAGVGSTCSITTTADAVIPGVGAGEQARDLAGRRVQVFDGGPDGVASTAGNTLFASQAVFVP